MYTSTSPWGNKTLGLCKNRKVSGAGTYDPSTTINHCGDHQRIIIQVQLQYWYPILVCRHPWSAQPPIAIQFAGAAARRGRTWIRRRWTAFVRPWCLDAQLPFLVGTRFVNMDIHARTQARTQGRTHAVPPLTVGADSPPSPILHPHPHSHPQPTAVIPKPTTPLEHY